MLFETLCHILSLDHVGEEPKEGRQAPHVDRPSFELLVSRIPVVVAANQVESEDNEG